MIGGATGKIEKGRKEKEVKKRNLLAYTTVPPVPLVSPPITRISPTPV